MIRRNHKGYRVGQDHHRAKVNFKRLVDNSCLAAIYYVLTFISEMLVSAWNGRVKDITGQRFGRLTVLSFTPTDHRSAHWLCKCDCGVERVIQGVSLRAGNTRSCGCLVRDAVSTHGLTKSPTYVTWNAMRSRCECVRAGNYHLYGAIGVKVCDRWKDFANFYADMGERPDGMTLDRHPNSKYESISRERTAQKGMVFA